MTFKVGFQRISITFTVQRYLPRPMFHTLEIIISQPPLRYLMYRIWPPPTFPLHLITSSLALLYSELHWIPTPPEHSLNRNTSPTGLKPEHPECAFCPLLYQTLKQATLPVIFGCPMGAQSHLCPVGWGLFSPGFSLSLPPTLSPRVPLLEGIVRLGAPGPSPWTISAIETK